MVGIVKGLVPLMLAMIGIPITQMDSAGAAAAGDKYPLHQNITATYFWVGEDATSENLFIPNASSCWDDRWLEHFGGIDDPENREGYHPVGFTPRENPFYFALPYNDFDENGRKDNALSMIPWAKEKQWTFSESICKNRWIKIMHDGKTAYAQWEDSGPFQYDDVEYVFGTAQPRNRANKQAGLDVSPAVRDFLGLSGQDKVDWQFVDEQDVPDGPWKHIVTTSQITWD